MTTFILASASPRRRALLALANYPFVVQAAGVDETTVDIPDPAQNALETAQLKAHAAAAHTEAGHGRLLILAADTTVAVGIEMLGKPAGAADARRMLERLCGRTHTVHTGMVLLDPASGWEVSAVHTAVVTMRPYTPAEVERYIASGDPFDKAGGYAIQHPGFQPVAALEGCFLGVMGLSVCQLHLLLPQAGVAPRTDLPALHAAHNGYPCPLLAQITAAESE